MLRDSNGIARRILLDQLLNGAKDQAMVVAVEVLLYNDISDFIPRILTKHESAKNRALCLQSMWRESYRGRAKVDREWRFQCITGQLNGRSY